MGYLTGYELFLLGTTASYTYGINVIYSIEAVLQFCSLVKVIYICYFNYTSVVVC
jgi:hypothetical protein